MAPAPGPVMAPSHGGTSDSRPTRQGLDSSHATSSRAVDASRQGESSMAVNAPKRCARCGQHIEALQTSVNNAPDSSLPLPASAQASSAPSPSSIAFAPDGSAQAVAGSNSISALLASTPVTSAQHTASENMQIDQDGHQICTTCAATHVAGTTERDSLIHRLDREVETDQDGDAHMVQPGEAAIGQALTTAAPVSASSGPVASISSDSGPHPWRRPAPWALLRNSSSQGSNLSLSQQQQQQQQHSEREPPLSISVGNMGAGGDALARAANAEGDADFPPLARSPSSNSQLGSATSPRLPLTPSRNRVASPPTSPPPALARQASFSRSQSTAASGGSSAVAPVVNFPARGRNRSNSGTGINVSGGAPSTSSRGRRTSATRRLSRSGSSQGPTATSFAEFGGDIMASGSALAEDGPLTAPIEEHPLGPASMTRPRISTLSTADIISLGRKTSGGRSREKLLDVHQRPFSTSLSNGMQPKIRHLMKPLDEIQEEAEVAARKQQAQQILHWLDCLRPDPRRDISLLRCTSRSRGCLFPGATFRGTQKSGRTSYDVTVQIVNVDLNASHLCGYLNIRGLTDDWPELTTFFDAEIIGQRYGFVTGKWGATEADDMKHWSRFAPFRPLRNSLTRPELRFNHLNKPFVFMRWKERFLVPDHRVRDITGASFAGFYYVCVELDNDAAAAPTEVLGGAQGPASPPLSPVAAAPSPPPASGLAPARAESEVSLPNWDPILAARREGTLAGNELLRLAANLYNRPPAADVGHVGGRREAAAAETFVSHNDANEQGASSAALTSAGLPSSSLSSSSSSPPSFSSGRMSGFYFHEHSEPYQQLSLHHIPESSSSTFELR